MLGRAGRESQFWWFFEGGREKAAWKNKVGTKKKSEKNGSGKNGTKKNGSEKKVFKKGIFDGIFNGIFDGIFKTIFFEPFSLNHFKWTILLKKKSENIAGNTATKISFDML